MSRLAESSPSSTSTLSSTPAFPSASTSASTSASASERVPEGWPGSSSAAPGTLLDYSGAGLLLSQHLVAHATGLSDALAVLASGPDPDGLVPASGDVAERFADLAGDWYHLDEFVGDVGRGFALFLDPGWDGDRSSVVGGVVHAFEPVVGALGHVGFADRDDAVNAAGADAEAIRAAIDDGRASADEVAALSARVGRGRFDPAYAVRFAEAMGPGGMVDVVGLIEDAYGSPRNGGSPEVGWGLDHLVPFGAVVSTAVDTLAGTPATARLGPGNAHLPDDQRLDRAWLDGFVDIGVEGDLRPAFHQSLLVSQAVLPATALLTLADRHVTARVRGGFEGPTPVVREQALAAWRPGAGTIETNIMRGLGRNASASERWLSAVGPDGTSNAEALLVYDVGPTYRSAYPQVAGPLIAGFGDAASGVWAAGLPLADADLFDTVVGTVDREGELHVPGMEPGLARGTAAHMDTVESRSNEGFHRYRREGTPAFEDTAVFLREVMRDDEAAATLRGAAGSYLRDRLADLPHGGQPRWDALAPVGRTLGLFTESDANAALAGGDDADAGGAGAGDRVDYALSWVWGVGPANDAADAAGTSLGEWIFGDAQAEARDLAQRRIFDAERALAANVALHHYETGEIDPRAAVETAWAAVQERGLDAHRVDRSTVEGLFLASDGTPRAVISPVEDMTPEERSAFYSWVFSSDVLDAAPGSGLPAQAANDTRALQAFATDARNKLVYES